MLIGAYGLFWSRDAVDWHREDDGRSWQLLGRRGARRPGLTVVDFRGARGVYVLYDHHGAYYAGLARGAGGLGSRLKQHLSDEHGRNWQRFSWFTFDDVAEDRGGEGYGTTERVDHLTTSDEGVVRELEALLITVLNTRNKNSMRFQAAEKWEQVPSWDSVPLLSRLRASR